MSKDDDLPLTRSAVARELAEVRSVLFDAAKKRDRLPQPLFWHLLALRLRKIREIKSQNRTLAAILDE